MGRSPASGDMVEEIGQLTVKAIGDEHGGAVGQGTVVDALQQHAVTIVLQAAAAGAPGRQLCNEQAAVRGDGDALSHRAGYRAKAQAGGGAVFVFQQEMGGYRAAMDRKGLPAR